MYDEVHCIHVHSLSALGTWKKGFGFVSTQKHTHCFTADPPYEPNAKEGNAADPDAPTEGAHASQVLHEQACHDTATAAAAEKSLFCCELVNYK